MWMLMLGCREPRPTQPEGRDTADSAPPLTETGDTDTDATGDTGDTPTTPADSGRGTGCGSEYAAFGDASQVYSLTMPPGATRSVVRLAEGGPSELCVVSCDASWLSAVVTRGHHVRGDGSLLAAPVPILLQPGEEELVVWLTAALDAPAHAEGTCTAEGSGGPWLVAVTTD